MYTDILTGVYFTGGSLNPARSLGPCVALAKFPSEHWIYWLGPILGSCLAVGFYRFIKALEFETANPGQDFNEKEAEIFNPDDEPGRAADVERPNPATGNPDKIAGREGYRRSRERDGISSPSGPSSPVTATKPPSRYDGAEADANRPGTGTSRTSRRPISADRYHNATHVEDGTMGGDYTVSGLR